MINFIDNVGGLMDKDDDGFDEIDGGLGFDLWVQLILVACAMKMV